MAKILTAVGKERTVGEWVDTIRPQTNEFLRGGRVTLEGVDAVVFLISDQFSQQIKKACEEKTPTYYLQREMVMQTPAQILEDDDAYYVRLNVLKIWNEGLISSGTQEAKDAAALAQKMSEEFLKGMEKGLVVNLNGPEGIQATVRQFPAKFNSDGTATRIEKSEARKELGLDKEDHNEQAKERDNQVLPAVQSRPDEEGR